MNKFILIIIFLASSQAYGNGRAYVVKACQKRITSFTQKNKVPRKNITTEKTKIGEKYIVKHGWDRYEYEVSNQTQDKKTKLRAALVCRVKRTNHGKNGWDKPGRLVSEEQIRSDGLEGIKKVDENGYTTTEFINKDKGKLVISYDRNGKWDAKNSYLSAHGSKWQIEKPHERMVYDFSHAGYYNIKKLDHGSSCGDCYVRHESQK